MEGFDAMILGDRQVRRMERRERGGTHLPSDPAGEKGTYVRRTRFFSGLKFNVSVKEILVQ